MSGKRNINSDSVPPATQPANKQTHSSAPAFRAAWAPSTSTGSVVTRTSRITTIKTNARGRRGYLTGSRHLQSDPLFSPSVGKEELPDGAVLDLPLPDLEQLNYDTETSVPPQPPKPKRDRPNTTLTKLFEWLIFRQSCLDELLWHDGLSDTLDQELCISCKKVDGVYKCKDCFSGSLLRCCGCLVNAHRDHPLHHIEIWNGHFFAMVTLQSLGLCVQLGHGGAPCPLPSAGPKTFCVFDTTGVHHISVNFCDCQMNGIIHQCTQLLRARWFPATFNRPKTAFTFDCLDTFHELTLQGKTPLYDFYHTVLHKTDNLELNKTVYRYPEFHCVFRVWRNLLMLKRAGRGQDPAGAGATAQGELAVECPACPHPDWNLPEGWQSAGPLLFLYTLFLAADTNFKLKGKDRGINDLELAPGWASFVEEGRYQEHIRQYVDQPKINTCQSEHDALVRAVVRCTPGYSVTGVGLCVCPRHCLIRKNGAGDLQKGERYCNMDYIILSSLAGVKLPRVVITYDIGCQWCKNFQHRMEEFADDLKLDPATLVEVGIPSWHINGHGDNCKTFCLGYMDGVGRTCGEEVETTWAQTNALGTSIREMGPGARHETLNDQLCGWNFRKVVGFHQHRLIFQQFSSTFPPQMVQKWEAMVSEWKNDRSKPNPYVELASSMTLQDEEAAEAARGHIFPHKVTLTTCLTMALDLEEQQYALDNLHHLRLEVLQMKGAQMSKQLADLEEKRLYYATEFNSGFLSATPDAAESLPVEPAESMPLYLPSSLPQHLRQLPELASVLEKEPDDALAEIRRHRSIISGLWQFKKLNDLKDNDIRGPGKDDNGSGNSHFEPSWIWLVPRVHSGPDMADSKQVLDDSLQVEWAKVQARKQRWEEEVLLIQEEMRRVVMFHEWKARWWQSQAGRHSDGDHSVIHGVTAYAEKQAYLCERLAQSCVTSWLPMLKGNGAAPDWEAHYPPMPAAADMCGETSTDDSSEVDDDDEGAEEIDEEDEFGEGDELDIDLFD
ncbi:hypothetical protein BJV78DRAFT_1277455 [Lactifluus subvellereus]|nr:hypothetical protein BJV78DRAFT_1277455 [Lactifluus subvellereus]